MIIAGQLSDHTDAEKLAAEVYRVHHRYATEVVGAFRLCPHMKDPESAFGAFCVVLDREPSTETAVDLVVNNRESVVHLIYPLVQLDFGSFETFGKGLLPALAKATSSPPVQAIFHPEMWGDTSRAERFVGVIRRAPDPFVQFVPPGLHVGGTEFLDPTLLASGQLLEAQPSNDETIFDRLTPDHIETIMASLAAIRADRDESYRPFVDAMADG
jgi:hypothetical protein